MINHLEKLRTYKTFGIIIKRNNFFEADRVLTVFTKDYGKIRVLAKGVRRLKSKRGGNVELFNLAKITLYQGKHFEILTEAEVINSYCNLRLDLKRIATAYYLCEIVDNLCPERQENRNVFEKLSQAFQILNDITKYNPEKINDLSLWFESFILKELGFYPKDFNFLTQETDKLLEKILEKRLKSKNFLKKINL